MTERAELRVTPDQLKVVQMNVWARTPDADALREAGYDGVEIMGSEVSVPEKNRLLRCFQYLSINTISYGDFCWNGECTNCQIWYHMKGQSEQNDRPALSCRLECEEGMVITRLSRFIELEGITK